MNQTTAQHVKVEFSTTDLDVDGNGGVIEPMTQDQQRVRAAYEYENTQQLSDSESVSYSVEAGARMDRNDNEDSTGAEIGLGIGYEDANNGLTVQAKGIFAFSSGSGYDEMGMNFSLQYDPAQSGNGMYIDMESGYGAVGGHLGDEYLWEASAIESGVPGTLSSAYQSGLTSTLLGLETGYRMKMHAGRITPYGKLTLSDDSGTGRYQVGTRVELVDSIQLNIFGAHSEFSDGSSDQEIRLQLQTRF